MHLHVELSHQTSSSTKARVDKADAISDKQVAVIWQDHHWCEEA